MTDDKKKNFFIIGLLLAGFFITGTIMMIAVIKAKKRKTVNKGIVQSTIDFISKEEGRKYFSYKDSAGNDTTGVGHLILPSEEHLIKTEITDHEIDTLLRQDLEIASNAIQGNVKRTLNQNQFDALISLIFNIGGGNFGNSTLLKYLNDKTKTQDNISNAWKAWRKAGGHISEGLEARRAREVQLFFS